jgi:molybdopterin molybdotransferase
MDGYAVRSEDVANAPARLRVVETIHAGELPRRRVGPGECSRIMTGAPLPEGADAVVMQERVRPSGEEIEVLQPAEKRTNVRAMGEDARAGELLLPKGVGLGIPEAALLWAQGLTHVRVPRRPRVAILSSGDELCPADQPVAGRLVDTNSPSIAEAVRRAGGEPTLLGIAADRLDAVLGKLEQAKGHDVVLTSAGVSVGERDFVRPALLRLGAQMSFWRVAVKPGKPLAAGTLGPALVVGLPGNPVSSLVTFELFVRPALRRLCGVEDVEPARVPGRLDGRLAKSPGVTHYVTAVARWEGGELLARPLATQTSGALRAAVSATHLIELSPEASAVEPGTRVALLPVSWA